jgi:GT2 family glycosyltransferase
MQTNNQTAIVLLNYKNYTETINCINSIYDHIPKESICIIVVDNASGNNSLSFINESFNTRYNVKEVDNSILSPNADTNIYLLQSNVNKGYAAGNNVGLRFAFDLGFKYLMVLNNDTLFLDNSLNILKNTLDNNKNALCVGPLLLKEDRINIDRNCGKRRPTLFDIIRLSYVFHRFKTKKWERKYFYTERYPNLNSPITVEVISGACMLFDANKLNSIDFFDEKTFLYYEEAIIYEKSRAKGYSIILDPAAKIIHLGAKSTKTSSSLFTLKSEYNSLKMYLTEYRKVNPALTTLLLLPNKAYILLYALLKDKK